MKAALCLVSAGLVACMVAGAAISTADAFAAAPIPADCEPFRLDDVDLGGIDIRMSRLAKWFTGPTEGCGTASAVSGMMQHFSSREAKARESGPEPSEQTAAVRT